jgi:hypothetical protein
MPPKKTHRVEDLSRTLRQSVIASHDVFEHPATAEEFEAVAVLAAFERQADESRFALPPLWPMLLHMVFADIPLPSPEDAAKPFHVSLIPPLMRALRSSIHRHKYIGAQILRNVLCLASPPIDAIVAAGAVPLLAKLLDNVDTSATQFEAACALTCVASSHSACFTKLPGAVASVVRLLDSSDRDVCKQAVRLLGLLADSHAKRIVDAPRAIERFVVLLGSADCSVCETIVRTLGTIAGESIAHRDLVLQYGALAAIVDMLTRLTAGNVSVVLRWEVLRTITKFYRGTPSPPLGLFVMAIPLLVEMVVRSPEPDVTSMTLSALAHITDGGIEGVSAVVSAGALPVIMHHASNRRNAIATPALRCLHNVASADAHHAALAIHHNAIPLLCTVLQRTHVDSKQAEILETLSAIAAGSGPYVNVLLQFGVFDVITDYVTSFSELTRRASQRVVSNALVGASDDVVTDIVGSTAFRALLPAATAQRITLPGVEGLETALVRGFAAVAAIASPDELSTVVDALCEIEDAQVQECVTRIYALTQGADEAARAGGG